MTTKDAILKLADAVSGNTSANVATDVQALAVLAQAMTGGVPAEPLATVDDAIGYIADNYSGGGGGVDVGAPTLVVKKNFAPEVGEYIPGTSAIGGVAIGEAVIVPVDSFNVISEVAAGVTATTAPDSDLAPTACAAYVVTAASGVITAAAPWNGTLTPGTYDTGMTTCNVWSFTVPALEFNFDEGNGQILYLYMH
jgi:hypothetical protein